MFKKISIIVLLILSLQGCLYQTVSLKEMEIAVAWCSDKGGVDIIREFFLGDTKIICYNGDYKYEDAILQEYRALTK